jgi:hypothetical protein
VATEPCSCRGEIGFLTWRIAVMLKRIALVGVGWALLLAPCVVEGQSKRPARESLPDAPSATVSSQAISFERVDDEARSLSAAPVGSSVTAGPANDMAQVAGLRWREAVLNAAVPAQKESSDFFSRHVYPSLLNSNFRYRPSDSDSLMGRATDAASRIFVTRDESGKRKLNTSYLLRVATSVAAHSAARTYRARSGTAPLGDFGSTVGNDAGMNLLHEFGPAVRKMTTSHLPEFVSRIEERIAR